VKKEERRREGERLEIVQESGDRGAAFATFATGYATELLPTRDGENS
jgi:hypothetical protein